MAKHREKSILPYSQEQLFELVADIERYPEFVPCWIDANIHRRDGDIVHVEQLLNLGAIRRRFVSKAVLQRPVSVKVTSNDGPFRHLDIHWQIESLPAGGCILMLSTEFQLNSDMLGKLLGGFFRGETGRLLKVFENRAHTLYGQTL
jgi:coenzyme Q-binding protein COQ10